MQPIVGVVRSPDACNLLDGSPGIGGAVTMLKTVVARRWSAARCGQMLPPERTGPGILHACIPHRCNLPRRPPSQQSCFQVALDSLTAAPPRRLPRSFSVTLLPPSRPAPIPLPDTRTRASTRPARCKSAGYSHRRCLPRSVTQEHVCSRTAPVGGATRSEAAAASTSPRRALIAASCRLEVPLVKVSTSSWTSSGDIRRHR